MQFAYPSFLLALLAVAIPIVIHLFHFRRYKKIIFSDIRFLKKVEEETRSRQRLKELLILLSRILAISFLVLAFAQPFIPVSDTMRQAGGNKAISIFLDNSFSMGAEGKDGILLEEAKNKGRAVVNAYGNDETFQVLTNDFDGTQQRLMNKADALRVIDDVKISSASKNPREVIARQQQAFEKAGTAARTAYLISDFQKSAAGEAFTPDSSFQLVMVPVQAKGLHNIYLDSVWLMSPVVRMHEPLRIRMRVRNSSGEPAENVAVTLTVNGVQKGLQNVSCGANDFTDAEILFTPADSGWQNCELSIIDHPLTFDDRLFFSLRSEASTRIMCINGKEPSPYIEAVFNNDPAFVLVNTNAGRIDYSLLKKQECVILHEPADISSGMSSELVRYVKDGGMLLVLPSTFATEASLLNRLLASFAMPGIGTMIAQERKAASVNLKEYLFRDVFIRLPKNMDLPSVHRYYELIRNSQTSGSALITLNDGSVFMHQATLGKGRILLLAAPLQPEWTNLQQHALFVPLMLKAAFGTKKTYTLYYQIDRDKWIETGSEIPDNEKILRLWGNGADMLSDIQQRNGRSAIYIENHLKNAGHYQVSQNSGSKATVSSFAMNYLRTESPTGTLNEDELNALVKNAAVSFSYDDVSVMQQKIRQELNGTQLWRACLMLALLFVVIEILLLKLLK